MYENATTGLTNQDIQILVTFPKNDDDFLRGDPLTIRGRVTWTGAGSPPFNTLLLVVMEKRFLSKWKHVLDAKITDITIASQGVMVFEYTYTPLHAPAQYLFNVYALDDSDQVVSESRSVLIHSVLTANPKEPTALVPPEILDQAGLKVYRIVPKADTTTDVEYVLTVRFEGGPILIGVADQSLKPTDTGGGIDELLDAAFTDAPTKWHRFEPDPYYRSPDQCVASGTLIFRVPLATSKFVKRVALSVVLTNYLSSGVDPGYRLTLVSANNCTNPLVVDSNGSVKKTDFGQLNIVLLIGESAGVALKRAGAKD